MNNIHRKTALITGITGQDGSYLAEFLLKKNYRVIGLGKKNSIIRAKNIVQLKDKIEIFFGDMADAVSLVAAIKKYQPDEVYNLASQSNPAESWHLAIETADITGLGAHRLYDSVLQIKPNCRIYQASSSEMFGDVLETPQSEYTPFNPINPYAAAKVYAHNLAKIYRKSYGMFISCGILFNHESPRRGMQYITQKVTYGAACIKLGIKNSLHLNEEGEPIIKNSKLSLGNLNISRDWGYAGDYVEAMWLMLQQENPDDFVIGTGISHTVSQLCDIAFSSVELNWQEHVTHDPRFIRILETGSTIADASKAKHKLLWEPKMSFNKLIESMVQCHLQKLDA